MITFQPPPTDRFQELRIPNRGHWARPYWYSYQQRDRLSLQFIFTDSCRYHQPPPNHLDWEKLMGLSCDWWTNHRHSGMITWRYNVDMDVIELGVYTHINCRFQAWKDPRKDGLELPRRETEVFMRVPIEHAVECFINVDLADRRKMYFSIKYADEYAFIEIPFPIEIQKKLRVINPFIGFGGRYARQDTYIMRRAITPQ